MTMAHALLTLPVENERSAKTQRHTHICTLHRETCIYAYGQREKEYFVEAHTETHVHMHLNWKVRTGVLRWDTHRDTCTYASKLERENRSAA